MNYGRKQVIKFFQYGFEFFLIKGYIDILNEYDFIFTFLNIFIFFIVIPIVIYFIVKNLSERNNKE